MGALQSKVRCFTAKARFPNPENEPLRQRDPLCLSIVLTLRTAEQTKGPERDGRPA